MSKSSGRRFDESSEQEDRFDSDSVRRILQRAAEEQDRLDTEAANSYTLEELEEIAKEVGISPEVFRAVAAEHGASSGLPAPGVASPGGDRRQGWLAAMEGVLPKGWSQTVKRAVLVAIGVALLGSLLLMPSLAPLVYVAVILSFVVVLLFLIVALLFL